MKKNIALLLSIVALILLIVFLRVNVQKEYTGPSGKTVASGIYNYDLNTNGFDVNGLTANDNEIYYLLMEVVDEEESIYNYELRKLNILTNEITSLGTKKDTNMYCTLNQKQVYCETSKDFQVYDLNLEEVFSYSEEEPIINSYAPYKDIYLQIEDKNIYLVRNNQVDLYRTIETEENLLYDEYFKTDSNTYLLYFDEEGNYYLYDVNGNNLESIEKSDYFKYENGFIFYDSEEFIIRDLKEEKELTYANATEEDYYYTATSNLDNTTLYLYDIIENSLIIENFEENTLQIIDTNIFSENNPLATLISNDEYLYIYVLQDKNNFFVLDLDALSEEKVNIDDYKNELLTNINDKIKDINENFQVNINIKENAVIDFPDFYAEVLTNNELILESLDKIETILAKYDETFFESFYDNNYDGLNLYLVGSLTPSDYETQASNPAAYSLTYNNEYMIVIDLNQPNIEELLCHELLHNLEFNLNNKNIYPFSNWNSYNPSNFYYNNSYTSLNDFNYTLNETEKENVYFIDTYSHTYATEDRARVFERICACSENSIINDYPNLYEKGLYLKEEITKYYPSLANTSLFASLSTQ